MKRKFLTLIFLLAIFSTKGQSIFDTLTYQEKIDGISKIWKEASYNFVFFDKLNINWDSAFYQYLPKALNTKNVYEYYTVLSEFASLLKDGHTSIMRTDYFYKNLGGVPINFERFGNGNFVTSIDERLLKEIPIGTEILAINDMPVDSFLSSGNSLSGLKGTELSFTFKSRDNKVYSKTIQRVAGKDPVTYFPPFTWAPFQSKKIDKEGFYVKLDTFDDSTVIGEFESVLPEIQKSKFLIIDIRNNGGGNDDYARKIAEHLVDKNYTISSAWKTRINNSAKKAWGSLILFGNKSEETISNQNYYTDNAWETHEGDTVYVPKDVQKVKIPIVILISKNTFSAAEDFLIYLDGSKNITTIGHTTAGSSGQPLFINLPKGITARVCAKRDTYPDGKEFINIGIKPDIPVEKNINDFRKNIDTELQYAITYLKTNRR
jgi:C-terminal processing protease CtpA/Prc